MIFPPLTVIGSVNLDFVATAQRLPGPGETVGGAQLERYPGGKGANQALAAHRLGAAVRLVARVGHDAFADEALRLLRAEGVDLADVGVDDRAATGVALIVVAADGENQIVVAPGANALLRPAHVALRAGDPVLCQLEVPLDTIAAVARMATGFLALNLAPAIAVDPVLLTRPDLLIVNQSEAAFYGAALADANGWVAVTHGARGAVLLRRGVEAARAAAPRIDPVDTTGAGDAFCAALTLALAGGAAPDAALSFACAAGALAATRAGAQPSLPRRAEVDALVRGRV